MTATSDGDVSLARGRATLRAAPRERGLREGWAAWRSATTRRFVWWIEIAIIAGGYLLYEVVRAFAPAHRGAALHHAALIDRVEQAMRIDIELPVNSFVSSHASLAVSAGYWYGIMHFLVTPLVLIWLYRSGSRHYAALRSGIVAASVLALAVFWLYPVAPPRFAINGATDTLVTERILGADNPHGVSGLVNEFAAMPSLHVGYAIWCALAVVLVLRTPWRHLAWLYPLGTTAVVVVTANHFLLDAVGGALALAAGFAVTTGLSAFVAADHGPPA